MLSILLVDARKNVNYVEYQEILYLAPNNKFHKRHSH